MTPASLNSVQRWSILGGAAIMLSLAMGMRQSFGLFQPHMVRDIGVTTADFSLAMAIQNIVWGITQPFVGVMADRYGFRWVTLAGVVIYAAGLGLMITASSALHLVLGSGICIGLALSCTASSVAMSVASRAVTPARRSVTMGMVSALGSLGLVLASPMAQTLISTAGWQVALIGFLGLVCVMIPAALGAGQVDRMEAAPSHHLDQSLAEVLRSAFGHSGYVVMALAFFVCGLQLVFITTHLPTYLADCGMDPSVGAAALAAIGFFNVLGSYLFGWLGGRYPKQYLLGGVYVLRSLVVAAYFLVPPTPATTIVFGAAMGALWLGVVPLVNGLVVELFGIRFMTTLVGIAFFSHQVGSFLGAWGGGLIYDTLGSYDAAWKAAVLIGLIAGFAQMLMNVRPPVGTRSMAPLPQPTA
ncbi:MFS transporter [Enterovirga aerilata]|uniref:MFS transporter n=1 Tax=Enterovirga aerilata TaxID=2730920 RepID=A0A849I4X4_9HYPH|nr:MFS transporter [Enterovirga sp. DB1703]NNM74492.1 MFS transporter [Enterovirga sp. DB1703]